MTQPGKSGEMVYDYFTIEEFIQYICFNNWNLRGTFISIDEMRTSLGIKRGMITPDNVNENQVLDFLQYAINCVHRVAEIEKKSQESLFSDDTIPVMLWENIEKLIEKLNCAPRYDEEKNEIYIVYNNTTAGVVVREYPEIEHSINEYIQIDNRGDLKRKAEVLCTLYKKLESYSDKFKGTTYKNIYEDTKFLFNKSGVRHCVEKDSIACATFLTMSECELERWYDKIFEMFLMCMVISKYLDNKSEIDSIKKGIGR